MSDWRKRKKEWIILTDKQAKRCRHLEPKKRGRFPEQERILYGMFKDRRSKGMPVKGTWLRARMLFLLKTQQPDKFDPGKIKIGTGWLHRYCKRWKLSRRRRTNNKKHDLFERLHLIRRFHWWSVYEFSNPSNYNGTSGKNYWDRKNLPEITETSEEDEDSSSDTDTSEEEIDTTSTDLSSMET